MDFVHTIAGTWKRTESPVGHIELVWPSKMAASFATRQFCVRVNLLNTAAEDCQRPEEHVHNVGHSWIHLGTFGRLHQNRIWASQCKSMWWIYPRSIFNPRWISHVYSKWHVCKNHVIEAKWIDLVALWFSMCGQTRLPCHSTENGQQFLLHVQIWWHSLINLPFSVSIHENVYQIEYCAPYCAIHRGYAAMLQ